jgi:hypothetical protein
MQSRGGHHGLQIPDSDLFDRASEERGTATAASNTLVVRGGGRVR